MSTNPTNGETAKPETEKISLKKTYEGFDENLTLQSKEVTVEYEIFTENAPVEKVLTKFNEINRATDAVNFLIRSEALKAAKQAAGISGGINRAVLMEFIKPYRELPDFAKLISVADKRKASAEEWNKQTDAICQQIKNVPFMMDAIRKQSAKVDAETSE